MDNSFRLLLFCAALVPGLAQQTDVPNRPSISNHGEALIGRNMTLKCFDPLSSTKSPLSASYDWIKDGKVIPGEHSRQIVFDNVSLAVEGDYTCRYKLNGSDTISPASNTFSVSMKIPPQVLIEQANGQVYRIPEGRNLSLTCSLSNTPNPSVVTMAFSWTFRPGNANESTTSGQVNLTDPKQKWGDSTHSTGHVLTVSYVNRSHSGQYTCHATNDPNNTVGIPSATASIQVEIQYVNNETVIITSEMPQPVVAGDKVTLKCQAYTTANLTWLHQGLILRTVESKEDVYSFPATGCQDSGEYQCRADNEAVIKSVYGGINVTVECPPTPTLLGNVSELAEMAGKEGEGLTLSVSARGTPPPVYTWSGPRLPPVTQSGKLELWNLQPSDAGIYTVNVSNKHGSFLQKFNVVVQAIGGAARVDPNIWMTVCGVIVIILLSICIVPFVLQKRKSRMKRRPDRPPEHQYTGLYFGDRNDSAGRRRSQEVADYTSGESTGQYWSIHSADLSWQPQAVQPQTVQNQDSLRQVSEERGYDVPPPPVSVTSPGTPPLRHQKPQPDCDVIPMDDVSEIRGSLRNLAFKEGEMEDEDLSLPRRCIRGSRESDQESGDSESYLACHVVSHGLPPSSLSSSSSTPQDDTPPSCPSTPHPYMDTLLFKAI